jgi:dUTP pyrophosphatase
VSDVTVLVQRLPHGAGLPVPSPKSSLAAGADLAAALPEGETLTIAPGGRALVPTGFAIAIPAGHEGQVRPRSGLAAEHGVTVLNAPGTIDADYRGEVKVILVNHGDRNFVITRGMRIAQLLIAPVVTAAFAEAAELPRSERGTGGFGSTGVSG